MKATIKKGKSPGIDGTPAKLIKASGDIGIKVMHKLCNLIWKTKVWPKDWAASVFVLPKKGDPRECKNNKTYR